MTGALMQLLWIVAIAIAGVFGAVITKLLADDVKDWIPRLVSGILRGALSSLVEPEKTRRYEQLLARVNNTPGSIPKLIHALAIWVGSFRHITARVFLRIGQILAILVVALAFGAVVFFIVTEAPQITGIDRSDVRIYFVCTLGNIAVELLATIRDMAANGGVLPTRYRRLSFVVVRVLFAFIAAGPLALVLGANTNIMAFFIGAASPLIFDRLAAGIVPNDPPLPPAT
jgi:hypothetical protein